MALSYLHKLFMILVCIGVISCAKTEDEAVRSAIQEAKFHLNNNDCSDALDVLDDVDFQEDNGDYISIYASAQACKAGHRELSVLTDELTGLNSASLLASLAAFSTSNEEAEDSVAYTNLDLAINTLLGYDDHTSGAPDTVARNDKFGATKSGDLSLQALYLIFVQLGKFFQLYGDVDIAAGDGAKGGGGNSTCIYSYTASGSVAAIALGGGGVCNSTGGGEGSDYFDAGSAASNKTKLCNGIIYFNNMLDILGNITLPESSELGDTGSISAAMDILLDAAQTAEQANTGGINNPGDANGLNAIAALRDVTSQSACEAVTIERIEKFYAIFFETNF